MPHDIDTAIIKRDYASSERNVSVYQMMCGKCDKLRVCKYSEKVRELTEKICKEVDNSENECGHLITFNMYCKENPMRISR